MPASRRSAWPKRPALVQQAAALGLKLERGDKDATWRITPAQP